MGHKRIGWLGGNVGLGTHETRFTAFKAALKTHGLTLNERYFPAFRQADRGQGLEAVQAVMSSAKKRDFPTAFICYNTLMAIGAVQAFEREGIKVPKAVSVCSADLSPIAASENPKITGSGSSPEKMGEAASRLALETTGSDDESFMDLVLPAQLFIGDTTGSAP